MNVANYLIQISALKFRITLPSRRAEEHCSRPSTRLFAIKHWNGLDEPKEYVFLREDLIKAILPLINNFEAKDNFLVRYQCLVYGHHNSLVYKFYTDAQRRAEDIQTLPEQLTVSDRSQVIISPELDSLYGVAEETTFRQYFSQPQNEKKMIVPPSKIDLMNKTLKCKNILDVVSTRKVSDTPTSLVNVLESVDQNEQAAAIIAGQLDSTRSIEIYSWKNKVLQMQEKSLKVVETKKANKVAKKPRSILKPSRGTAKDFSRASCDSATSLFEETPREDVLKPILASLQNYNRTNDLGSMMAYVKDNLLLKRGDHQQRQALVERMEKLLNDNELRCKLTTFGSTKNGLGLKTSSDIDIFVRLLNRREHPIDEMLLSFSEIRKQLEKLGKIMSDCGESLLPVEVDRDGEAQQADKLSVEVICHQHMRVPLVRVKFLKTKRSDVEQILQCDLNVNNALGIANTKLIKFLCRFEPRFMMLNVLLRFWAKEIAQLNRPDALSSYALTNMILYYFQRGCRPVILPAVNHFVLLSDHHQPKIVNDWRCDFCTDINKIHWRTKNSQTLLALMLGFFEFWSNFEFDKCKISTRHGKTWQLKARNRNTSNGNVPAIHIMDPFEQSHNLTSRIKRKYFARLCDEMKLAIEKYRRFV